MNDLQDVPRKWNRRKDARPAEIITAALDEFVEKGFADAKLTEVAKRAGIVKGTLYRYFDNKEALFRAVAQHALATNMQAIEQAAMAFEGSLDKLVPLLLTRAASCMGDSRLPAILRMVVAESRAFSDLARIWHDEVAARLLALLTRLISEAQARGTARAGDPKLYAFSIMGPMLAALLFHEVFGSESTYAPDLEALAVQHAETVLKGIMREPLQES